MSPISNALLDIKTDLSLSAVSITFLDSFTLLSFLPKRFPVNTNLSLKSDFSIICLHIF